MSKQRGANISVTTVSHKKTLGPQTKFKCWMLGYYKITLWSSIRSLCLLYCTHSLLSLFTWRNENISVVQVKEEVLSSTDPEASEVSVGGVVGLVVSFHQAGDDPRLLVIQPWPLRLPGRFLLLPLHDHFPFPLNLLICQYDCKSR